MAYWAELNRRGWYCINSFHMINWYKQILYDEWWESLTEEQKELVIQRREQERLKREEEMNQILDNFYGIGRFIRSVYNRPSVNDIRNLMNMGEFEHNEEE